MDAAAVANVLAPIALAQKVIVPVMPLLVKLLAAKKNKHVVINNYSIISLQKRIFYFLQGNFISKKNGFKKIYYLNNSFNSNKFLL